MGDVTTIEGRIDRDRAGDMVVSSELGGLQFQNMLEVMEFAKMMAVSDVAVRKHLRGNPGACLGVTIQAFEWRMSPFAVANKSYAVNDQLAYEAQLIHAVILTRAPIKGRPKHVYTGEGGKRKLKVWAVTLDGETVEYESPEIGSIKPKNSPLWVNDPDQQLHYFSVRSWCRRHFPEVILGVYAVDELGPETKDVTPKGSGLASRLSGAPTGGFDPNGVEEAIGGAQEGETSPAVTEPVKTDERPPVAGNSAVDHDPECMRAGGQALVDGEVREAPADFSPGQAAAWLAGYDQTAEAAMGGRQN
jgi:hypothetical protein